MTIRHTDRAGKPWTFRIDCTPIQGRMFERLLTAVRTIGNREQLTLSYLSDVDGNTAFRDELEHAVLSALRDWAGTSTETPEPSTIDTEPDEREPYYWENF